MPSPGDIQASAPRMRGMFTRIAGMYDRLNRVQSLGLDVLWRRRALARLARVSPAPRRILDLATGTADFALAAARRFPSARVAGVDLTPAMLEIGRRKVAAAGLADRVALEEGNACALARADGSCARSRACWYRADTCSYWNCSGRVFAPSRRRPRRGWRVSRACSHGTRARTTPTCARRSTRRVRRRNSGDWRRPRDWRPFKENFFFLPVHVSYSAEIW